MNLVFLLEEPSAKNVLDAILSRIVPADVGWVTIAHRGKSDLRLSLPRKLMSWRTPDTYFVVVHDQDSHDCKTLKQELREICQAAGRADTVIRIVCHELEAWYFGDLEAVDQAFPGHGVGQLGSKRRYRDPDAINKPSAELERLIPGFHKGLASQAIPEHMLLERNRSRSFQVFVQGLNRLLAQEGAA
jgi:hypothetical protein